MARNDSGNSPSYDEMLSALKYRGSGDDVQAQFDVAHTLLVEHGKRINEVRAAQLAQAELLHNLSSFNVEEVRNLSKLVLGDPQLRIVGLVTLHDQMTEVQKSIRALVFAVSAMGALLLILIGVMAWTNG